MRKIPSYFWNNGNIEKAVMMVPDKDNEGTIIPLTTENISRGGGMGLARGIFRRIQSYFWNNGDVKKTVLMVVDKDDNESLVPLTSDMLFGGGSVESAPTLPKFRGVMYWPRLSPSMDMWRELSRGTITWADVEADLDQLQSLDINLIRVFTFYDHEYRKGAAATDWPTDGRGNYNQSYYDNLGTFIDMCAARNMYVVPTMFQEMPGLRVTDNWDWLEVDLPRHKEHLAKIMQVLKSRKEKIPFYNLKNEPDGFGVWGNDALASRVLTWLKELKEHAKSVVDIPVVISSATHDNAVFLFPNAPVGARSILEISDVLAFNTFRWADNGSWSGTTYKSQLEFVMGSNPTNKPVMFWECGYPANYDGQEEGLESIVPIGGEFDRPQGNSPGTPHTVEGQFRSVSEGIYWAEAYNTMGVMVWSAYDHKHPTQATYRDPFGIIDRDGNPLAAAYALKVAFTNTFPITKKSLSLAQGEIAGGGGGTINGLHPWNAAEPTKNVPGGIYLTAGATWSSAPLAYRLPARVSVRLTPVSAFGDESPAILLETPGRSITVKYKDYGVRKLFVVDTNTQQELAQTQDAIGAEGTVLQPDGNDSIGLNLSDGSLRLFYKGSELPLTAEVKYAPYEIYGQLRLKVVNSTGADFKIMGLSMIGNGPMTRNENFYNARTEFIKTRNM